MDADVGQFAVAEPAKLAHTVVVTAPLAIDANDVTENHGR
jgi:hypothetical protein